MSGLLSLGLGSLSAVSFWSDPLGYILWGICKILFNALSGLENVFRALTGMSPTDGVGGESGDVIVEVLQSDVTRNIMFSLTLFGVCVLVLTVILAIIRNVYKDDSKVTVSSIFGQAVKAVMGFILIPALCIVGVVFSNVILKAVDGATKNSEARSSSFVYGIINATSTDDGSNVFRDHATPSDDGELTETQQALIVYCNYLYRKGASIMGIKDRVDEVINKDKGINTLEEMIAYYEVVSELFLDNFPDWKEDGKNFFGGQKWKQIDIELKYSKGGFLGIGSTTYYFADDKYDYYLNDTKLDSDHLKSSYEFLKDDDGKDPILRDTKFTLKKTSSPWTNDAFDKAFHTAVDVNEFYALLATILVIMSLWKLSFGLAKRIVQLIVLYVLSPIALAMYPWDNGSAFGSWKKDFVGYTIGAYGAVAGMNLTIQIMPIITKIQLSTVKTVNSIIQLLLIIVLAQGIGSLVSTLSGWIGGKDLLKEGGDTAKAVAAPVAAVAGAAIGAVGMGAGVVAAGAKKFSAIRGAKKAGQSEFAGGRLSSIQGKAAENKMSSLTLNEDGTERSAAETMDAMHGTKLGRALNKQHFWESDEAFADRTQKAVNRRAGMSGLLHSVDYLSKDNRAERKANKKEFDKAGREAAYAAKKQLQGTGAGTALGKMAGKLGNSALGLMGSASGIDVQKSWADGMKAVLPDYEKSGKGKGLDFTGKAGAVATNIANATHAGVVGAALTGAAGAEIARDFGAEADKSAKMLANVWALEMQKLTAVLGKKYDTKEKVELLLSNPAEMAKLSKPKLAALSEYQRNTSSFAKEEVILQNSIEAAIAIESGFTGADEGKLRDLSRKGAADGFKDAKAYLLGEVQKSVEKSGKKWTGDMASEIEKQLDKYFKQNFKPNKD